MIITAPSKHIVSLAEKYLIKIGCIVKVAEHKKGLKIEDIKNLVLDEDGELGILYSGDGERIALTDGFNTVQDEKYYLLSY